MEGRQIVLNDGTIIPNGEVGYSEGTLCCWFYGYTMQEAANLFFDSSKTSRIVFDYGDMEDVYVGFTNCTNIGIDTDGRVFVVLVRGGNNA